MVSTTQCKWDTVIPFEPLWKQYNRIIKDNGAIVLFGTEPFSSHLRLSNLKNYKYEWIWEKDNGSNFVHVKHQPFKVHESVLIFGKLPTTYNKAEKYMKYIPQFTFDKPYTMKRDGSDVENLAGFAGRTSTINKDGKRYPRSVQKFNLERGLHPTQKPTKLFEFLIKTYTDVGGRVVDVCCGSGTTAKAAKNTDRIYIVNDNELKYVKITEERIGINSPSIKKKG